MKEYRITEAELESLKHAIRLDNKQILQQIIQDVEFRGEGDYFDYYSARVTYLLNTGMNLDEAEEIAMKEEKERIN